MLWVMSASDGKKLAEYKLESPDKIGMWDGTVWLRRIVACTLQPKMVEYCVPINRDE